MVLLVKFTFNLWRSERSLHQPNDSEVANFFLLMERCTASIARITDYSLLDE